MEDKNIIFDYVVNRPIKDKTLICPFCNSENIDELSHESTLLGSVTNRDPNHHWIYCKCKNCEQNFTQEYKLNNVWYTFNKFVIKGIPSCFEQYILICKCGGHVKRLYRDDLKKEYESQCHKKYKCFYKCKKCNIEFEYPSEYYLED